MDITHKALVELAGRWLERRCGVVLTEYSCWNSSEIADAIGLRPWPRGSILVECKASRDDFLKDRRKPHRATVERMGNYRYYLTPRDMVNPAWLPEGWGLLSALDGRKQRVKVVIEAPLHLEPEIKVAESQILYSLARRAVLRGLLPKLREDFDPMKKGATDV